MTGRNQKKVSSDFHLHTIVSHYTRVDSPYLFYTINLLDVRAGSCLLKTIINVYTDSKMNRYLFHSSFFSSSPLFNVYQACSPRTNFVNTAKYIFVVGLPLNPKTIRANIPQSVSYIRVLRKVCLGYRTLKVHSIVCLVIHMRYS